MKPKKLLLLQELLKNYQLEFNANDIVKAKETLITARDLVENSTLQELYDFTILEYTWYSGQLDYIKKKLDSIKAYETWGKVFGEKIIVPVPEGTVKHLMQDSGKTYEECELMFKRCDGNYKEAVRRLVNG